MDAKVRTRNHSLENSTVDSVPLSSLSFDYETKDIFEYYYAKNVNGTVPNENESMILPDAEIFTPEVSADISLLSPLSEPNDALASHVKEWDGAKYVCSNNYPMMMLSTETSVETSLHVNLLSDVQSQQPLENYSIAMPPITNNCCNYSSYSSSNSSSNIFNCFSNSLCSPFRLDDSSIDGEEDEKDAMQCDTLYKISMTQGNPLVPNHFAESFLSEEKQQGSPRTILPETVEEVEVVFDQLRSSATDPIGKVFFKKSYFIFICVPFFPIKFDNVNLCFT
jgi:hypothetical protein